MVPQKTEIARLFYQKDGKANPNPKATGDNAVSSLTILSSAAYGRGREGHGFRPISGIEPLSPGFNSKYCPKAIAISAPAIGCRRQIN